MKPVFSMLVVVCICMMLPFSMRGHGDHRLPEKYFYIQRGDGKSNLLKADEVPVSLGDSGPTTAPFDNGLCLLIVMGIGIGLIKAYHKIQKDDISAAV